MLVSKDTQYDIMFTKDWKGNMIQVSQIKDGSKKGDNVYMGDYAWLCFPIIVQSYSGQESLIDILESRKKLQEEVRQKDEQNEKNRKEYEDLKRSYRQLASRKWWQFNKFLYREGIDY